MRCLGEEGAGGCGSHGRGHGPRPCAGPLRPWPGMRGVRRRGHRMARPFSRRCDLARLELVRPGGHEQHASVLAPGAVGRGARAGRTHAGGRPAPIRDLEQPGDAGDRAGRARARSRDRRDRQADVGQSRVDSRSAVDELHSRARLYRPGTSRRCTASAAGCPPRGGQAGPALALGSGADAGRGRRRQCGSGVSGAARRQPGDRLAMGVRTRACAAGAGRPGCC